MWSRILEEAESSWLGENNYAMLKMCNKFENLMESKIQFVRIWHRHGNDIHMYKQEHNPTDQELRAIEIAQAEDYDESLDSIGTEYNGYHTISELLSFKSIKNTLGNDAMTKALDAEAHEIAQWQDKGY
jgi:hypothetical protein